MGKIMEFDEDQHQAERMVESTFMESPQGKKLVKETKKQIKTDKAKIRRKISKTVKKK